MRTWTSVCISLDLVNNIATLYVNGKNQDDHKVLIQKYDSWIEKVPELHNGYILDLGRYYWDKSFVYITYLDVNAWDKTLSPTELAEYSNCKVITPRQGSLVDESTEWNITGNEIQQVKYIDTLSYLRDITVTKPGSPFI